MIVLMSGRLIWSNYDQPIVDFSDLVAKEYHDADVFFPFNHFLSFPATSRVNCLGVTMWLFVLNRLIDISLNKLALTTAGGGRPVSAATGTELNMN